MLHFYLFALLFSLPLNPQHTHTQAVNTSTGVDRKTGRTENGTITMTLSHMYEKKHTHASFRSIAHTQVNTDKNRKGSADDNNSNNSNHYQKDSNMAARG